MFHHHPSTTQPHTGTSADPHTFHLGTDEHGTPVCWNPHHDPHTVIVGSVGTGKTVLTGHLIDQATARPDRWDVTILNTHLTDPANTLTHLEAVLSDEAHRAVQRATTPTDDDPRHRLLVLDEVAPLLVGEPVAYSRGRVGRFEATQRNAAHAAIATALATLSASGRFARTHLVMTTQHLPLALGPLTEHLTCRVGLGPIPTEVTTALFGHTPTTPADGTTRRPAPRGHRASHHTPAGLVRNHQGLHTLATVPPPTH